MCNVQVSRKALIRVHCSFCNNSFSVLIKFFVCSYKMFSLTTVRLLYRNIKFVARRVLFKESPCKTYDYVYLLLLAC